MIDDTPLHENGKQTTSFTSRGQPSLWIINFYQMSICFLTTVYLNNFTVHPPKYYRMGWENVRNVFDRCLELGDDDGAKIE